MDTNETTTRTVPPEAGSREQERPVFLPAADVYETPDAVLIQCEMPGVAESGLELTLENRTLSVSGTQEEQGREGYEALAGEYLTGVYQRTFNLNRDVDESAVKARLKNGILEIELPKARESRARRIPIEPA